MGVTENYLFSPIMELFSYKWGSRGNFGFINPIIPMGLKRENLEVLLNGSRLTIGFPRAFRLASGTS